MALPGALGVEAEPMTGFNRQKGKYRNKTKKRRGSLWADRMKHSSLVGKAARVIYTSMLCAEIEENGAEMPTRARVQPCVRQGTARGDFD